MSIDGRRMLAGHAARIASARNEDQAFELNNKLSVFNAVFFYRSLPDKNGSTAIRDDRVILNI
ncbi:hypothetical protein K6W55_23430 [Burkholderia dolosa]|nr:hypothetical protein [Burkholderia dolosa]